jgi:choline dehydrogenase-like flavoprotein
MADNYDVIVIGAGLGGLTAAAKLAQSGRKTLLVERNYSIGGAASTYKSGDLSVETSLHEASNPKDPTDPKHHVLVGLGVLDQVEWVQTPAIYDVRGAAYVILCRLLQQYRQELTLVAAGGLAICLRRTISRPHARTRCSAPAAS